MAVRQDTLWAQYLFPLFQNLLDKQKIAELQDRINWQAALDRYQVPGFRYPNYYEGKHYHGIEDGYLTSAAAVT